MKTQSNVRPPAVIVEKIYNGNLQARLTDNVVETNRTDENGNEMTMFEYDEYVYETKWSEDAVAQIRANPGRFIAKAKAVEEDA